MKRLIIGVFAHPDDEGFGPSGTLYKLAQDGMEVHLILATGGDAGRNPDGHASIGEVRMREWQASSKLIGAASSTALGLKDGCLCNEAYLQITEKVVDKVVELINTGDDNPLAIDMMTFDPNGLSGHIDHITVSLATTLAYLRLKQQHPESIGTLKYFGLSDKFMPQADTSWIYMPKGRPHDSFDEVNDVSDIREQKLAIMRAHASQRDDMESILSRGEASVLTECFWYYRD